MRLPILALAAFFATFAVHAAPSAHSLLFQGVNGVSEADQKAIAKHMGWRVAPGGKGLAAPDCGPIPFQTRALDLNGDTTPEILIVWGNACTSGHTGSSVSLFVKGAKGYAMQMGFPGFDVLPLPTKTRGWADLRVEGSSECQPVWAWTGRAYDLKCSVESRRGACREMGHADKLCKR
jgi:hypothetical protein